MTITLSPEELESIIREWFEERHGEDDAKKADITLRDLDSPDARELHRISCEIFIRSE